MDARRSIQVLLFAMLLAGVSGTARAQSPTTQPSNILMQLMRSQPDVDITTRVVASASFDPPEVRRGEKTVYRVTFNALESAIRLPDEIPSPWGLTFRLSAKEQILQPSGGKMRPVTTFNYDVRGSQGALFTVPSFVASVYGKPVTVPAATVVVADDLSEDHEPARQLVLEADTTNVFFGETLTVRAVSTSMPSGVFLGLTQIQFEGEGLLANKNAVRQSIRQTISNHKPVMSVTAEAALTLVAAGQISISAHAFAIVNERPKNNVPSATPPLPEYLLLDSDPIVINVRPLPAEGRLPGFTGAVGEFTRDPPRLSTNTAPVGQPVQLAFVIRGDGDLERIGPPMPPRSRDWQIFDATFDGIVPGGKGTNPGAVFVYTLIPLANTARETPAIPFSYFDPKRARYVDLTLPPVSISVVGDSIAANPVEADFDEREPEEKPKLSSLAKTPGKAVSSFAPLQTRPGFLYAQLAPAVLFSGLWFWARRRRFLERHPEIVRRNRARRELRRVKRSLHHAAARSDTKDFAFHAVRAMQVASAPHYPAEPGALVCGDVLNLLDAETRHGQNGEIARRFFATADASRFAVTDDDRADLLNLQVDFEKLLAKLEERL